MVIGVIRFHFRSKLNPSYVTMQSPKLVMGSLYTNINVLMNNQQKIGSCPEMFLESFSLFNLLKGNKKRNRAIIFFTNLAIPKNNLV